MKVFQFFVLLGCVASFTNNRYFEKTNDVLKKYAKYSKQTTKKINNNISNGSSQRVKKLIRSFERYMFAYNLYTKWNFTSDQKRAPYCPARSTPSLDIIWWAKKRTWKIILLKEQGVMDNNKGL